MTGVCLPRLLVVDDEPLIISALNRALRNHIEVIGCTQCQDAMSRLATEEFDAILAEVSVYDIQGLGFVERLEKERPELIPRLILASGGKSMKLIAEVQRRHSCPFLQKPIATDRILEMISQIQTQSRK